MSRSGFFKGTARFLRATLSTVIVFVPAVVFAANVDVKISGFSDTPDPAVRGGNITFAIQLENSAIAAAMNVVVTFPLPLNTQFVSAGDPLSPGACVHNGAVPGTMTCTYPTLAGSSSGGVMHTITAVIKTTGNSVAVLSTEVEVTTADTDTDPVNNKLTQNTTIASGADLYATISGSPNPAQGGSEVTWSVAGGNQGPNDAPNSRVQFTLPSSLTYVSAGGGAFNCSEAGGVVTCNRASNLAVGASFTGLNLVTKITGVASGVLTLGTDISSLSVGDPDTANNGPTANVTVTPGADLRIVQGNPLPSPGLAGQPVTFVLNPSNVGPSDASAGVAVTYQLPPGFTFTSSSIAAGSATGWAACTANGSLVTCNNTGNYASGRNNSIHIVATAPSSTTATTFNNITATIAPRPGSPSDPVAGNNSDDINLTIVPDGIDLSLTKIKSPNPAAVGNTITSVIAVKNDGPQAAPAGVIQITDVIDITKESFVSATGNNWSCNFNSPNLVCTYNATLNANATQTNANSLTITTTAIAIGVATNNASVACVSAACPGDWNSTNNTGSGSVTVTALPNSPDLLLQATATTSGGTGTTLEFNEQTLTYNLVLTNKATSPTAAQDVDVRFAIPGFVTGLTANPVINPVLVNTSGTSTAAFSCSTSTAGVVSCAQTGVLAPGDRVNFSIPVDRTLEANTYSNQQATAFSTTQGDPDRNDNVSSVTVTIEPIADVEMVSKAITSATSVATQTTLAGTQATYVLTFKNKGYDLAAGLTVTDVLTVPVGEPGFTFISANGTGSFNCSGLIAGTSYGAGNHTLTCTKASMDRDETQTVTVVIRPNFKSGQTAGSTWDIGNTATITTTTKENAAGTDNGNNSKSAVLHVDAASLDALVQNDDIFPGFNFSQLGYDPSTPASNDITYQVAMTNGGPSLATGLRFTYTMTPPAGKTVIFRGDGNVGGIAAANPAGNIPGSYCDNLGNSITGPTTLTVTCTYPTAGQADYLASGATARRYLVFRLNTTPDPGGNTLNTNATVFTNEADTVAGNQSESETTSINVRADLVLSKVPSINPVQLRQPFNWTLTAVNNGPGDSLQTILTDTLPANMEFSGATPTWSNNNAAPGNGSCGVVGKVLTCNVGSLENGRTVIVTVPVRMTGYPTGGTIQNCAAVSSGSSVDPVSGNSSSVCSTLTVQRSSLAGIAYRDIDNDAVRDAGEAGIDGVTVTLNGTDLYGNVVSRSLVTSAGGTFNFNDLSPADASGYTLVETQPTGFNDGKETVGTAGGTAPNSGFDSTAANNTISAIALPANTGATGYLFGEIPLPGIGLSKSAGAVVNNGDGTYDVPFTLTVINSGGLPLTSVQITDNLTPEFGTHTTGTPGAGQYTIQNGPTINAPVNGAALTAVASGVFTGSGAGNVLLIPGSSGLPNFGTGTASRADVRFTVRFFPTTAGPFNNTAVTTATSSLGTNVTDNSVDGATPDADGNGDPTNDTSPTVVSLDGQVIGIAKSVGTVLQVGTKRFRIPYTLIVQNISSSTTATNVQVTDNLNATFPTAQSITISSPAAISACTGTVLNAAPAFNGTTQTRLLTGNQNLQHGERCTISFTTEIDFGANPLPAVVQNNQATATTSQTPGGTVIATDLSNDGVDIDPNSNGNAGDGGENVPTPVDFSPAQLAAVSGKVYLDRNHDSTDNDGSPAPNVVGFIVEVLNSNDDVVGTAITAADGTYTVGGLISGTYKIRFREPGSGMVYGNPQSIEGAIENGEITQLPLPAGTTVINQNLPLDPSGVVYDAVSRNPVSGATVTLVTGGGAGIAVPGFCLVGGTNTQVTGATGMYQFLLINPIPAGCPGAATYTLQVTQPAGYLAAPSGMIPPTAAVFTPVGPGVNAIQAQAGAPTGGQPTTYYFSFQLTPGATGDVVNNHIPLDPILSGAIIVSKTTPLVNVVRSDLVPYTVTATNTLASTLPGIELVDNIPAGFRYKVGSATLNGAHIEPVVAGRKLTWLNQTFGPSERKTIRLLLVVGTGVSEGEYVNQALARNTVANAQVSNLATATVRVVPDPTFDCSDIIGKVFDDKNANGYQDQDEPGIPNVRVATARGLLVTTDHEGRFHVACADIPNADRGANFVMKLDERTLPSGYRVTTENPRDVRVTRGKMTKLNFGATVHRVVRVELSAAAFDGNGTQLQTAYAAELDKLPAQLQERPSVLRIAYRQGAEPTDLAQKRVDVVSKRIRELWKEKQKKEEEDDKPLVPLMIETEMEAAQ